MSRHIAHSEKCPKIMYHSCLPSVLAEGEQWTVIAHLHNFILHLHLSSGARYHDPATDWSLVSCHLTYLHMMVCNKVSQVVFLVPCFFDCCSSMSIFVILSVTIGPDHAALVAKTIYDFKVAAGCRYCK